MYNAKLKSSFDEVKRIAFHIEKAVRHKKVFCLGGSHFPSAGKVIYFVVISSQYNMKGVITTKVCLSGYLSILLFARLY